MSEEASAGRLFDERCGERSGESDMGGGEKKAFGRFLCYVLYLTNMTSCHMI